MIHIVIDTSIFRKDPHRRKASFDAITTLGKSGKIKLHIPYFIKNEHISQKKSEYLGHLNHSESNLNALIRKPISNALIEKLRAQLEEINNLKIELLAHVEEDFATWTRDIGADLYEIEDHHGSNIAQSYFEGGQPFGEAKKRTDIPDAFIFETIKDISQSVDELYVIVHDSGLKKACDNLNNVTTFQSLKEFIQSDVCSMAFKDRDFEIQFNDILEEVKKFTDIIKVNTDTTLPDALYYYKISDSYIPDDNNEASITSTDDPTDLELDFDKTEYFGGGTLFIPFTCNVNIYADYWIFKNDYLTLSEERSELINIEEYGNKHYYEAQEEFDVAVEGRIAIEFDLSSVPEGQSISEAISALITNAKIAVDEIDDVTLLTGDFM